MIGPEEPRTRRSKETVRYYGKVVRDLRGEAETRGENWSGAAAIREIARRDLSHISQTAYLAALRFVHAGDREFLDELETHHADLPARTRRRKTKSVTVSHNLMQRVILQLESKSSPREGLTERVVDLIIATRLFGLRPSEWAKAEWADAAKTVLRVRNGKFARQEMKSGPFAGKLWKRANGKCREIILPKPDQDVYQKAADAAIRGERDFPWKVYDRQLRRLHDEAAKVLADEGIMSRSDAKALTIYSYRHSFAADAKYSLDLFGGEVAALMGHISVQTATRSYARRATAKSPVTIRPTAETLAAVENRTLSESRVVVTAQDMDDDVLIEMNKPQTPRRPAISVENETAPENPRPTSSDRNRE